MKSVLLKIASLFYGAAIKLRHLLFDMKVLHSERFDIPIICVGNITVGGTGKTPTVEMLVEHYSQSYNVAVLSRGYGRVTKGYRVVEANDYYRNVGDEPLQIKRKFPNVVVVVCEKRVEGVRCLREEFPDVNMVIMDDGFQHRYIKPLVNIVIADANRPVYRDHLFPVGNLRDTLSSLHRAHIFIVTKCPDDIKPIYMREYLMYLIEKPSQVLFFTRMQVSQPCPIFAEVEGVVEQGAKVIAMSGIGNNLAFKQGLESRYEVVEALAFDDHHAYRKSDLAEMERLLSEYPDAVIMTTEKDAVKLRRSRRVPEIIRKRLFYMPMIMEFIEGSDHDFLGTLKLELDGKLHFNSGQND
jgi:tetraacyldisaccharide 4'-kinase